MKPQGMTSQNGSKLQTPNAIQWQRVLSQLPFLICSSRSSLPFYGGDPWVVLRRFTTGTRPHISTEVLALCSLSLDLLGNALRVLSYYLVHLTDPSPHYRTPPPRHSLPRPCPRPGLHPLIHPQHLAIRPLHNLPWTICPLLKQHKIAGC